MKTRDQRLKTHELRPGSCFLDVKNQRIWFIVSKQRHSDDSTLCDIIQVHEKTAKHFEWLFYDFNCPFYSSTWVQIHE